MTIKQHRLVVKESGIYAVENYIMARYHMYWQIYYHPISRSFEAVLTLFFKRMQVLYQKDPANLSGTELFFPFLKAEEISIDDFFFMDESSVQYGFHVLTKSEDEILADLAGRLLNRHLFRYETLTESRIPMIKIELAEKGLDPDYYCYFDRAIQKPYQPYRSENGHNIWVWKADGSIVELSQVSSIVHAIAKADIKENRLLFYP